MGEQDAADCGARDWYRRSLGTLQLGLREMLARERREEASPGQYGSLQAGEGREKEETEVEGKERP